METYHVAWLSAHPERTEDWLRRMLKDGFRIHHMDGNHFNDDPKNLVLIEAGDHMMIHNGSARLIWKPPCKRNKGGRPKKVIPTEDQLLESYWATVTKRVGARRAAKLMCAANDSANEKAKTTVVAAPTQGQYSPEERDAARAKMDAARIAKGLTPRFPALQTG